MAFTVLDSWDFRGGDTSTVKRTSRLGGRVFTEGGSPSYDASGVTLSGASAKLWLTAPAELKPTQPFWYMMDFQVLGSPTVYTGVYGMSYNDVGDFPYEVLSLRYFETNFVGATNTGGEQTTSTSVAWSAFNGTFTLKKKVDELSVFSGNTQVGIRTEFVTDSPTYTSTSRLYIGNYATASTANPTLLAKWLLIGTGDITTGDMSTIQADPDSYIYPAAGPSTAATLGINKGFIR